MKSLNSKLHDILQMPINFLNYRSHLLAFKLFQVLPVSRNKIVFNNFGGRGFGDNPKYIALEILKRKLHYKLYWVVKDDTVFVPKGITKIKYKSLKYLYEMETMKVFVNNIKNGYVWNKKDSQYYIQTWHGSLIMKYVEREVEETLNQNYVRDSKRDSKIIDTFLVASEDDKKIIDKWFWYDHELWATGSPRSDVFFNASEEKKLKIKEKIGVAHNVKMLLYAPTFRDDQSMEGYKINLKRTIESLEQLTGESWVALVRLHPNVASSDKLFTYDESVINVCSYPDPQDLCLVADAMITDYSSIMLDMFLQKKPVFLYTCDYDDYIAHSRPMHSIYNKLPCKRNNTEDELIKDIDTFDAKLYNDRLKHFMDVDFVSYDDGHASERVVDRIQNVIENNVQSNYYNID